MESFERDVFLKNFFYNDLKRPIKSQNQTNEYLK